MPPSMNINIPKVIKTHTHKRKIICYIEQNKDTFWVKTGKPSDRSCISWKYTDQQEAIDTAKEFFNNFISN